MQIKVNYNCLVFVSIVIVLLSRYGHYILHHTVIYTTQYYLNLLCLFAFLEFQWITAAQLHVRQRHIECDFPYQCSTGAAQGPTQCQAAPALDKRWVSPSVSFSLLIYSEMVLCDGVVNPRTVCDADLQQILQSITLPDDVTLPLWSTAIQVMILSGKTQLDITNITEHLIQ